jgi:hypothetical protein
VIEFSRHARNKMRRFHITESDAIEVVTSPDTLATGRDGKPNALKAIGGRVIRAVYVIEHEKTIVVTIHPRD